MHLDVRVPSRRQDRAGRVRIRRLHQRRRAQQPDEPTPFDWTAVNAIRAQINTPDLAWWDKLTTVRVPTLIIGGARSPIPPTLLADSIKRMPDAQLVTLDAGHHVHQDRPAEFTTAVQTFLQR